MRLRFYNPTYNPKFYNPKFAKLILCLCAFAVLTYICINKKSLIYSQNKIELFNQLPEQKDQKSKKILFKLSKVSKPMELRKGLMFRHSLPHDEGMLFDFNKEDYHTLWMKNTYIPLDAIFLDSNYRILDWIDNMKPHSIQSRGIKVKSRYIIEINGSTRKKYGFKKGNKFPFIIKNY